MKYAVENGDAKIRSLPERVARSSGRLNESVLIMNKDAQNIVPLLQLGTERTGQ